MRADMIQNAILSIKLLHAATLRFPEAALVQFAVSRRELEQRFIRRLSIVGTFPGRIHHVEKRSSKSGLVFVGEVVSHLTLVAVRKHVGDVRRRRIDFLSVVLGLSRRRAREIFLLGRLGISVLRMTVSLIVESMLTIQAGLSIYDRDLALTLRGVRLVMVRWVVDFLVHCRAKSGTLGTDHRHREDERTVGA